MQNLDIFSKYIPIFLLILLRAGVFVSMLPFLSSKNFPPQFKIGFAVSIALILTPVLDIEISKVSIPLLVIREIMFGLVLGGIVRIVLFAVDMAGQIMSNAMGLSIATVMNPEIGQSTELARLLGIMAMMLLLSVDAHHDLIYIFVKSYEWIPVGSIDIKNLMLEFISMSSRIFIIALKISAPVTVGMLIANLLLGFIYKAAPQINIFFISFPVYIVLGFLIMLLSIPIFAHVFIGQFGDIKNEMYRIIAIARS
jgi:flagellar biosynthetic protein FliR